MGVRVGVGGSERLSGMDFTCVTHSPTIMRHTQHSMPPDHSPNRRRPVWTALA